MSGWLIALIVVGGSVGYILAGFLTSIVIAAVQSAHNHKDPTYNFLLDKADSPLVILAGILWPLTVPAAIVAAVWFGARPVTWRIGRVWQRAVKRLNPHYKGLV